ncbi:MAG: beta-galactosidase [Ktedonobacterales bacterium]|nr:beta-galactosidase [Ktedonobacterales bacterium]
MHAVDPALPPAAQRIATPFFLIDHHAGHFAGGRWLISPWRPPAADNWLVNAAVLQQLIALVSEGVASIEVHPTLACYQSGERTELRVVSHVAVERAITVMVRAPDGAKLFATEMTVPASPYLVEQRFTLPITPNPGLYQIIWTLTGPNPLCHRNGFWVWDTALVDRTHGQACVAGRDGFSLKGNPFLVFGTTYMDRVMQRKYLVLPNPARWDHDFVEMREAGVNLIRTGIWTAWRDLMPLVGQPNEALLPALDAFIMTASAHNMQVIFTFFAFPPPLFEGENLWLDPRAPTGQRAFITAIARRYADNELVSWDLINEPSFGDPRAIFAKRPLPLGDRFEQAAWQAWLQARYTLTELALRWRMTPTQMPEWKDVALPTAADYSTDVCDTAHRHPLRLGDYVRFSQAMVADWATHMAAVIRATGSHTLITVGQDEAEARPTPQFYAPAVDYRTTHPWWNVDALLWDLVLDKTPTKPNLAQRCRMGP